MVQLTLKMFDHYYLGLDIGSVSVNTVIISDEPVCPPLRSEIGLAGKRVYGEKEVVFDRYIRHKGHPVETVLSVFEEFSNEKFELVAVTGSGGKIISELTGAFFVNEIVAQAKAIAHFYPEIKTVIEIGGEDSKLLLLKYDKNLKTSVLEDFATNTICAAGTGSFLDQQASRFGLSIEEFSRLALKSKNPPRIAGRCSVFAKTDMIHLQQSATPDYDIIAGLCYALARNFKSVIAKGKKFQKPIAFQGGVAANKTMVKAFETVLELKSDELVMPKYFASMGAIGAVLHCLENHQPIDCRNPILLNGGKDSLQDKIENIRNYLIELPREKTHLPPLLSLSSPKELSTGLWEQASACGSGLLPAIIVPRRTLPQSNPEGLSHKVMETYLGIDVGSISTNLVVIDEQRKVLARRYLWTAGRPLEAVKQGLKEIGSEIGERGEIRGVGTTGSGRYFMGDFVGADVVKNEITAQARAAIEIDPKVDTIFEIGGQDSKYISLKDGRVIDFEMNKVCAAGTGSFLEEQAERLNIRLNDFGQLALESKHPVALGERCTVFMESDLLHHQQKGARKEDLVAGLCYSIVYNYLNRVVSDRKIGNNIFFQGGVAYNKGVVAAFEAVTGKKITVPPNHDVTGAIGAAILAQEKCSGAVYRTNFRGFELAERQYSVETFECQDCANTCEVRKVLLEGTEPLFYGSRCEKYERKKVIVASKERSEDLSALHSEVKLADRPDLFAERERLLFSCSNLSLYSSPNPSLTLPFTANAGSRSGGTRGGIKGGVRVGIPRTSLFLDFLPFFSTFLTSLDFKVILSDKTNQSIIHQGLENIVAEICFPIKVVHGHILNLIEKKVDAIFLPSIITLPADSVKNLKDSPAELAVSDGTKSEKKFFCPYVQTLPYLIKSALSQQWQGEKIWQPIIRFHLGKKEVSKTLIAFAKTLGKETKETEKAVEQAFKSQMIFEQRLKERGREILESLASVEGRKILVILGRSYNTCDFGLNLDLPKKLKELGIWAVPLDFLPISEKRGECLSNWPNMYWRYGERIMAAAEFIRQSPHLFGLYLTNFGCGPDSFIIKFFSRQMGEKPFLQLEIDEHSADVGIITRLEAFLDSLKHTNRKFLPLEEPKTITIHRKEKRRTLYLPYMSDHAFLLASAFRACGQEACVMEESDEETLTLGRKFTTGKECYPAIITTGDIVKFTRGNDFDPNKTAFLMPQGSGPCRFGQYHRLHRLVLNEIGFPEIPIYSPNQGKNFYKDLGFLGPKFLKLSWQGIVVGDLLERFRRQVRPYETEKGLTDKIYQHYLSLTCQAVEKGTALTPVLKEAKEKFKKIAQADGGRPLIGIVGEIFVRSCGFSNNYLIRLLEELDAEVSLPPVSEWFFYINYTRKREAKFRKDWRGFLETALVDTWQKYEEHRLAKIFDYFEAETTALLRESLPYLHHSFEGEAVLSVGKTMDFIKKGISGIVLVMPFTCMPGTIVATIMKRMKEDFPRIPMLVLAYDGLQKTFERTLLEAFVYQAREYSNEK
ncbi:MAG: acyl-CoA dehydratase activase [Candidatus Edwardsbacteria bacterium]